ncbi:hypothetical protein CYLTODRAFT_316738, partial [Cylindrobasidium torrendii FP15055 ss-10]
STLWAHLQQKDASLGTGIALPPMAPVDKTSTSMRILLHDTQAHFETFSDRVEKLTTTLEDTQKDIPLTKNLFEKEHENLSNEVYGLANRCQMEIVKAVGQPLQAPAAGAMHQEMQLRLESIDRRIDSMQLV